MPSARSSCSSGRSVNELNTMYINCDCQLKCMLLISYTNENFGRLFFKCNSCGFFEWWDAVNRPNDPNNEIVNTQAGRSTSAANQVRTLMNMVRSNTQSLDAIKHTVRAIMNKLDATEIVEDSGAKDMESIKSMLRNLMIGIYLLLLLVLVSLLK